MSSTHFRPWPLRRGTEAFAPQYRLLLTCDSCPHVSLLVTPSSLTFVRDEADALGQPAHDANTGEGTLELGVARSDFPKELDSSWKMPLVSFMRRTPVYAASLATETGPPEAQEFWENWLAGAPKHVGKVSAKLYGAFVRSRDGVPPWVPICAGSVRSLHVADGDWLDVFVDPETQPHATASEPRSLKLSLVMLAASGVWLSKYQEFWTLHRESEDLTQYGFFNLLHGAVSYDQGGHFALFLLVLVHHARMVFGVEFATRDTSFFRAKLHAPEVERRQRVWAESLCLSFIVASSVLLTYLVSSAQYAPVVGLLLFQAFILLFYDWLFWDPLINYDEDRLKNRNAVGGDVLFFVVCVLMAWPGVQSFLFGGSAMHGPVGGFFLFTFCIMYLAVFMVESWVVYWTAVGSAFSETWEGLKQTRAIVSSSWKKTRAKYARRRAKDPVAPALGR